MSSEHGSVTQVVLDLSDFWTGSSSTGTAVLRCPLVYDNSFEESIAI